jgi:metal-dependent amidase/aminoacylase/carboxypeptidase family protein
MMECFGISRVFGMHNMPGLPIGKFSIRPGAIMAASAVFSITIEGRGGQTAHPDLAVDAIVAGTQIVSLLQTIVSRNHDPLDALVVTVPQFNAGTAFNVIPIKTELAVTVWPAAGFSDTRLS